jgi:hypothetical protein
MYVLNDYVRLRQLKQQNCLKNFRPYYCKQRDQCAIVANAASLYV